MDADALDDHLDQPVVHAPDYPTAAGSAGPPRTALAGRRVDATGQDERRDRRPEHEAADVGEERDAARRSVAPSDAMPSMSWSTNQNAEDDDRRHVDELVEEAQEDERRDAGPREEHQVGAEGRGDGARGADRRDGRGRVDGDLGQAGHDAAREVESRNPTRPRRSSTLLPKIHRYSRLPSRWSQPPCRNWLVTSVAVSGDR